MLRGLDPFIQHWKRRVAATFKKSLKRHQ